MSDLVNFLFAPILNPEDKTYFCDECNAHLNIKPPTGLCEACYNAFIGGSYEGPMI